MDNNRHKIKHESIISKIKELFPSKNIVQTDNLVWIFPEEVSIDLNYLSYLRDDLEATIKEKLKK